MFRLDRGEPILRRRTYGQPEAAGVWGVRNYHTTLERRAKAGAAMTGGYLAMVVTSGAMATAGLLLDSAAIVIGSMCVAPFMGPSRAVCIGGLFRDWGTMARGLVKQLLGLLVIGTLVAMIITWLLTKTVGGIEITDEILLRAMPTTRDVVLSAIVAVAAGAAASLALVTEPHRVETPWGQVIDAVIGVEIAISLIPPASVIGIGIVLGMPEHSTNAFYLLMLNVVCLDLVGSASILAIRGVRLRHLQLEKQIRETVASTLDVVPGFTSVRSDVDIRLHNEHQASLEIVLRRRFGGRVPEDLAKAVVDDVAARTSCNCDVTIQVVPVVTYSAIPVS